MTLSKTRVTPRPSTPRFARGASRSIGRSASAQRWRPSEGRPHRRRSRGRDGARLRRLDARRRARPPWRTCVRPASQSNDGEVVGHWALAEEFAPGGTSEQAAAARARLDAKSVTHRGMWASFARAVIDEAHGDPRSAAAAYVATLDAAAVDADPTGAAVRLVHGAAAPDAAQFGGGPLRGAPRHVRRPARADPATSAGGRSRSSRTGARPRSTRTPSRSPTPTTADVVGRMGCARGVRIAGPFGHGSPSDRLRSFPAGAAFPVAAGVGAGSPPRDDAARSLGEPEPVPRARRTSRPTTASSTSSRSSRRAASASSSSAVQGAVAVWVDGTPRPLERSRGVGLVAALRRARVTSRDGRHRVVARTLTPATSVRILNLDGTAARVETDGDPRRPRPSTRHDFWTTRTRSTPFVRAVAGGDASVAADPIVSALAAHAAEVDQMDDVASALDRAARRSRERGAAALSRWPRRSSRAIRRSPRTRARPAHGAAQAGAAPGTERSGARASWRSSTTPSSAGPSRRSSRCGRSRSGCPASPRCSSSSRALRPPRWHGERMRALADLAQRFPDDVARPARLPRGARRGRARRSRPTRSPRGSRSSIPTPRSTSIALSRVTTGRPRSPSSIA